MFNNTITTTSGTPTDYGISYDYVTISHPLASSISATIDAAALEALNKLTSPKAEEKEKKSSKEVINPYDEKIKDLLKRAEKNCNCYPSYIFFDVKEYVHNKVYEFTIKECGGRYQQFKIKTVCDETDTFDLDFAFFLALAKALHQKVFTPEGYVLKAKEFQYHKDMIKIVSYGKKLFTLLKEKEVWEQKQEENKKLKHKKYVEKKIARKKKKEQTEDDRLTNAIKKAIKED